MAANPKHSNFISRYRQGIENLIAQLEQLDALGQEGVILDYATNITAEDFEGENSHVTKAQLIAAFQSLAALDAFLGANGNAHNAALYKVKR